MKRGRKPYSLEFAKEVREDYLVTKRSIAQTARAFRISEATVNKMIDQKGCYKVSQEEIYEWV